MITSPHCSSPHTGFRARGYVQVMARSLEIEAYKHLFGCLHEADKPSTTTRATPDTNPKQLLWPRLTSTARRTALDGAGLRNPCEPRDGRLIAAIPTAVIRRLKRLASNGRVPLFQIMRTDRSECRAQSHFRRRKKIKRPTAIRIMTSQISGYP